MNWAYAYDPHLWPPLITTTLTILLGWYSWRRRHLPGARSFATVCLFISLWALGSTLEMSAAGFSTQVFWVKFQAVWQLPTATALLCFVLQYAGFGRWLTRRNLFLLAIPPLLTLLLIVTNDHHNLIWTGFRTGGHVVQSFGSANWVLISYAYVLGLINVALLLRLAIRYPQRRWPVAIMVFGQIAGLGFYLLANIYPGLLNPGERVSLVLGSLLLAYAFAFFRFHFLDPVPAARAVAIEQMGDGMLVLDLQGGIVDSNPAAAGVFGGSRQGLLGRPVTDVIPVDVEWLAANRGQTAQSEISLDNTGEVRHYSVKLSLLTGRGGQPLGHLVLLSDMTEQKRAEAQVLEQQRVVATLEERERLARELHDGIGQVLSYVGIQAQTARKWVGDGHTDRADSMLERLIDVAKDAHADVRESILSLRVDSAQGWAFIPALKQYLDSFQANYGIRTELSHPGSLEEDIVSPTAGVQVLRVIQEALTNARRHGRARAIKVVLAQTENQVHISITDDGCGFTPGEAGQGRGNHFGLVSMSERMQQIGGSVQIESAHGTGTVVRLYVPVQGQGKGNS
ncbi:MAG: histidine kinase N-terminal 7TM domain-containing protein [Dehalococcoidia bacterium]